MFTHTTESHLRFVGPRLGSALSPCGSGCPAFPTCTADSLRHGPPRRPARKGGVCGGLGGGARGGVGGGLGGCPRGGGGGCSGWWCGAALPRTGRDVGGWWWVRAGRA